MDIAVHSLEQSSAAHLARVRTSTGVKLPDAVVLELAQSLSASVMTVDDQLARAAQSLGIDVVPSDRKPADTLLPLKAPRFSVPAHELLDALGDLPPLDSNQLRTESDEFFGDHEDRLA